MVVCAAASLLIGCGLALFLSLDIPDIRSLDDYKPLAATILLDRNGKMIDTIAKENRIVIPYGKMGKYAPKAFVAAEDSRYWQHPGLDGWSIFRAFINNIRSGRRSQGGSTITQQVTRALMLSREKTYFRKVTEAILAYRLDRMLSKEEVLTIYLNEVYLGEGLYGIEAAAQGYFGKSASALSLAQVAVLAGLPQAPSRYSPRENFSAAKARQRYVLNRMAEDRKITAAAARKAYDEKLALTKQRRFKGQNGWFADYVKVLLGKEYGENTLYRGGLVVSTTLDVAMQHVALKAVQDGVKAIAARQKTKDMPQGALIALDDNGRIKAMVGGTQYRSSQYNRAVSARRQPGSVFKPFIYAAALEKGLRRDMLLDDSPFSIRNRDGSVWQPQNFSGRYHGPTTLQEALVFSRNIPTIRLLQKTGLQQVIQTARKAGIHSELKPELTLALGASSVTPLEMTGAYTIFSGEGLLHSPTAITRVRNRWGKIRPWPQPQVRRVLSAPVAREMKSMLQDVVRRGTGRRAGAIRGAAGKTGTSNGNRDAWFMGFDASLTCGVWLGYDKGRSLGQGETGGRAAAPVWRQFMEDAGR